MRCAAIATGLALLVGASACGSGPDPASTSTSTSTPSAPQESPMADAIVLKQNLPTKVDGTRVVAFCSDATVMGGAMGDVGCRVVVDNVTDDGAGLQTPDGRVSVDLDGTVELDGRSYTVVETVPHSDEREGTRPNGWVSLRRR